MAEVNGLGLKTVERILRQSPNGVIVADANAIILFMNPSAEKLTGVKREIAMGMNFHSIFPQIELDEEKHERADINGRDLYLRKFGIREEAGTFRVVIMQNLSNLMKLSSALERTRNLAEDLTSILEGSFDGVLVTDGEGKVLMANQSYERITGLTREEMVGNNMRDMLNPDYMRNSVALIAIEKKSPVSLHHTTRHGRNIIVTGTPILDEAGNVSKVVINARDISEIYELQQELQKAREMEKVYYEQLLHADERVKIGEDVVAASASLQNIFVLADKLSNFNTTVMILGESGVGKEVVAKYIHNKDEKRKGDFISVNCGAIPENLLESELFGYSKGAFTGANIEGKEGLFEAANGGTLFLDEIGELPTNLQVKLLRVLETYEITPVGSTKPIPVNVRILVATNRNLEEAVKQKTFRKDLYYRLNVVQIKIPPLRERTDDIAPLAMNYLNKFNNQYGQKKKISYEVLQEMLRYPWPGNVRELRNTIERMVIISNHEYLQILDLPWFTEDKPNQFISGEGAFSFYEVMESFEKKILEEAVRKHGTTRKIAAMLKIDQATVVRKMKKYKIDREKLENDGAAGDA